MAFKDYPEQQRGVQLLQRSLERGRLGHAYLFSGNRLDELEGVAATLAKTLNCLQPVKSNGAPIDCCDKCINCQKIEHGNHADVFWIRPESKLRLIKIDQISRRENSPPRVLLEFVNLKPTEGEYKTGIIVAADRMNENAANAFLKTLEEPPAKSILVLLTTEPQRILETIRSRCLRLNFSVERPRALPPEQKQWLAAFSEAAAAGQKSLLGRYRLMDVMLKRLTELKTATDEALTARSPLQQHQDAEKDLQEKWEDELKASIEAEYRRQRAELLRTLQWWLRDIWLLTLGKQSERESKASEDLLCFPDVPGSKSVAERITPAQAVQNLQVMEQLQRWLSTNVQEALALEVGLLKLHI
ncbi:MAG TPA: hypothetical protein VLT36_16870 [Candidatus Dormibacteraeota bacterium]|nr:hypothetical protein [Candidatus Dormibacteraeota bacterium]